MTSKRVAANYYPEGGSINILEDLFRLEKRQIPIYLTAREKIQLAGIGIKTGLTSVGGKNLLWPGRISGRKPIMCKKSENNLWSLPYTYKSAGWGDGFSEGCMS
jgi:hypothetical protein